MKTEIRLTTLFGCIAVTKEEKRENKRGDERK